MGVARLAMDFVSSLTTHNDFDDTFSRFAIVFIPIWRANTTVRTRSTLIKVLTGFYRYFVHDALHSYDRRHFVIVAVATS